MTHFLQSLWRNVELVILPKGDNWAGTTPKLFIHVPKTAGTSFRSAAEAFFGSSGVLRDYGPESADTSQSIKDHVYAVNNPSAIVHAVTQQGAHLVSGHFPLTKYRDVFSLSDTAALIRNPVAQVVSHFQHMAKHYGYEGTLLDFARKPQYRNVQSQYIGMVDPALIGLVGQTEDYRSFLKILNKQWGWRLPHRRRNVGNWLGIGRIRLSQAEHSEIERLNAVDKRLYRRVLQVFANRKTAYQSGFRSDIRGGIIQALEGQCLRGWALDMLSPEPVTIDVMIDGVLVARTTCDQPLPDYSGWKLPGSGLAGFTVDAVDLVSGNLIEILDSNGGILLDSCLVLAAK